MAWSRARSYSSYTIKKKEVQVKQKKRYCEFCGWRNGANTQLNTPAKANLLFQNKRKRDFISYDTNQTIWMGYFSILNIKKVIKRIFIFCLIFIKY
jgi:hypothetical protein